MTGKSQENDENAVPCSRRRKTQAQTANPKSGSLALTPIVGTHTTSERVNYLKHLLKEKVSAKHNEKKCCAAKEGQ